MVLVGGFVHQAPVKKGTSPVQNNYRSYQVQPVALKELPVYEEAQALSVPKPVKSNASAAPQSAPAPSTNTAASTNPPAKATTSTKGKNLLVSDLLQQTLGRNKLQLF
jgi:hypothetical protein